MRERLWDQIHKTANDSEGGVWHYKPTVHMEVTNYVLRAHRNYSSILDVAVNQGYMLARLARVRPRARHYGSDVSGVMVAAAQKRCPKCKIMQYDLARLFDERGADVLPVADVVIVSDVLNFMPWAGLPAYFSHALPVAGAARVAADVLEAAPRARARRGRLQRPPEQPARRRLSDGDECDAAVATPAHAGVDRQGHREEATAAATAAAAPRARRSSSSPAGRLTTGDARAEPPRGRPTAHGRARPRPHLTSASPIACSR